ncbi:hypothetical protein AAFN85_00635 [Mucilaginibacter sp. CAU 1740]|uniref:hypothetical protein n=1 Tax=Mucilaginibacter sp. CAU 1740 TaxID=3140365 RepID=UPI00325BB389
MPNLHLIYDFANESLPQIWLPPVVFFIAGLIVLIYHLNLSKEEDGVHGPFKPIFPGADSKGINTKTKGIVFGALFTLIGCVVPLLLYFSEAKMFQFYQRVCKDKSYQTVQGRITQFHHSNSPYHDTERFYIDGVYFEFNDNTQNRDGYSVGTFKSDPLKQDLFVRICYLDEGKRKVILKLETE